MVSIRNANFNDIENLIRLNQIFYLPNVEDPGNGFISIAYGYDNFKLIISNNDLFVFIDEDKIIGYVLVNTVLFSERTINVTKEYFHERIENFSKEIAFGYQVLIDKSYQGKGYFYSLQTKYFEYFKLKYAVLVSTVNKKNIRSIMAHKKAGWTFINTPHPYFIIEQNL